MGNSALEQLRRMQADRGIRQPADMSLMGRVRDNVFGVDDGVMSTGEKIAAALNKGGESLTLGLVGDEAGAALDAAMGRGTYESRRDRYRAQERQLEEENPGLALAAEVGPAFIPGAGAVKVAQGAVRGGRLLRGALAGATMGATYGAMEGEGAQDRIRDGISGALIGAGVGAAIAPFSRVGRPAERPSVGALKFDKNQAYKAVDQSGFTFSGADMDALYDTVRRSFADANYVDDVDNAARASLRILERQRGRDVTLSQLDSIRQNLWKRYGSAKDQPMILDAIRAIDDLVESKSGASALMSTARAANAAYAKSQLLQDAFQKASDQVASTGSGGNTVNKFRQAVTSIINNPRQAKFFSPSEIEQMRRFVHGTPSENMLRLIGKMSPSGNGLMQVLHTMGAVTTNGATIPAAVAGYMAKGGAERAALRGADGLMDMAAGHVKTLPALTRGQGAAIGGATAGLSVEPRNALAALGLPLPTQGPR